MSSGGTPTTTVREYWGGKINWISPKDFRGDLEISSCGLNISEEGRVAARLEHLPVGTVVLVVRSGVLVHTLPAAVLAKPATINQDIKALKFKDGIEPKYIAYYLGVHQDYLLPFVRKHGATVHSINTPELLRLNIPIPPLDVQRRLVAELDAARAERDRALAEAESLLGSLDRFVLDSLGVYPEDDKRRLFSVRLSDVRERLDADYNSPRFQRLRRAIAMCKFETRSLGEITDFMRSGFAAGRQDQARGDLGGVPHLRPLNLNAWGELSITETKSVPASAVGEGGYVATGEVLFNNTNSAEWVGKSAVFDLETPCACSNHMTRIRLNTGNDSYFVAAFLNALRGIGYFSALSTFFNNQAGINTKTLAELLIPVPPLEQQKLIANEVTHKKKKAEDLRAQADAIWRNARERFEQQLLQGGNP